MQWITRLEISLLATLILLKIIRNTNRRNLLCLLPVGFLVMSRMLTSGCFGFIEVLELTALAKARGLQAPGPQLH